MNSSAFLLSGPVESSAEQKIKCLFLGVLRDQTGKLGDGSIANFRSLRA